MELATAVSPGVAGLPPQAVGRPTPIARPQLPPGSSCRSRRASRLLPQTRAQADALCSSRISWQAGRDLTPQADGSMALAACRRHASKFSRFAPPMAAAASADAASSDSAAAASHAPANEVHAEAADGGLSSLSSSDAIVKCISRSAEVSVTAVVGTSLVQEAQRRHTLAPTAAAALGRLLMGTLLLGSTRGPQEVVQVSVNGRGPIGQMTAVATDEGSVKGFVRNPSCDPPLNVQGKMDVGAAVGSGVLSVVRTHPSWQQPYTGTVPLQSGEIAEDLAHYLAESEQVNSALGLGVAVGRDGGVIAAGGFLVQVLPLCSEETLVALERNVRAMPPVSDAVHHGVGALGLVGMLLQGLEWEPVSNPVVPEYGPCGADELRPRMLKAVESLGRQDVEALLLEQGKVEVRCEFCAETIAFGQDDVDRLFGSDGENSLAQGTVHSQSA